MISLKETYAKTGWRFQTGFISTEQEQVSRSCEHGNENSVSTRGGKFLKQRNDYRLLAKDPAVQLFSY
jgi:hypothetical protein